MVVLLVVLMVVVVAVVGAVGTVAAVGAVVIVGAVFVVGTVFVVGIAGAIRDQGQLFILVLLAGVQDLTRTQIFNLDKRRKPKQTH